MTPRALAIPGNVDGLEGRIKLRLAVGPPFSWGQ